MRSKVSPSSTVSELDRAFHVRLSPPVPTEKNVERDIAKTKPLVASETSELDRAFHEKRSQVVAPKPSRISSIGNTEITPSPTEESTTKPLPPSKRYDLSKFEQKYRAFVEEENIYGTSTLVDDVYDDRVLHMMDGVPMDKHALKKLYMDMQTKVRRGR
mmetsp:Transcript_27677/g.58479  ORF Transcript_27677/g.58479 Transcript_27677/m.58479 type:complete len:159 (-) Transcript_27677:344-820(-)